MTATRDAAVIRGESLGGTILGPDGRVISRVMPGVRTAEEIVPQMGKLAREARALGWIVDGLSAFAIGTPLAVPIGFSLAGAAGFAQLAGPQWYAWKRYTTPSANADPGTPGYYAWHDHLARALQVQRTHGSVTRNIWSGPVFVDTLIGLSPRLSRKVIHGKPAPQILPRVQA